MIVQIFRMADREDQGIEVVKVFQPTYFQANFLSGIVNFDPWIVN